MTRILSVELFQQDIPAVVSEILSACEKEQKKNRLISATGAHGIVLAQNDVSFRRILNSFYVNLPDGMPAVWIGRIKGAAKMKRCYGPDFFRAAMQETNTKPIRHYFCGGKEGIADELKQVCANHFKNVNVVGTYSPPFRDMTSGELKKLAQDINERNADIVWIGLSTPKQERFAHRLSQFTNVHFICTIGAGFDFHTNRVRQAPKWIQNTGMEWFFRLLIEPKRLWRRYFSIVPLFIWYNLLELLRGKFDHKCGDAGNALP